MPLYCYFCPECERQEELRLEFDHDTPTCSESHEEVAMKRDFGKEGMPGIHFKGEGENTGFHSVDYD